MSGEYARTGAAARRSRWYGQRTSHGIAWGVGDCHVKVVQEVKRESACSHKIAAPLWNCLRAACVAKEHDRNREITRAPTRRRGTWKTSAIEDGASLKRTKLRMPGASLMRPSGRPMTDATMPCSPSSSPARGLASKYPQYPISAVVEGGRCSTSSRTRCGGTQRKRATWPRRGLRSLRPLSPGGNGQPVVRCQNR